MAERADPPDFRFKIITFHPDRRTIIMNSEIIKQSWQNIKEHIRDSYGLSNISYKTWIEDLEIAYVRTTFSLYLSRRKRSLRNRCPLL